MSRGFFRIRFSDFVGQPRRDSVPPRNDVLTNVILRLRRSRENLLAMTNLWFEELAVDDRTTEGKFVGIFEVVAETEAARKGRHLDSVLLYLTVYVE